MRRLEQAKVTMESVSAQTAGGRKSDAGPPPRHDGHFPGECLHVRGATNDRELQNQFPYRTEITLNRSSAACAFSVSSSAL